ncbi:hypothetical protein [Methylobacterium gnaphalii]|uniref:Uncharacterized protein n=1 Tax=Methylobacterium gnaphalii TaxID=1010610 RepID=A0A512JIS9_9HYPH|nr:hypothetical protein [Methylobacterium gnaphalii]GEP09859.1 hypothetical protein MGN01_17040 [Methylobacterium gnaphalii]GJD67226.1 hypothetical protein MMMDOFMJ_0140 [Methylobacterium gnaphalii]
MDNDFAPIGSPARLTAEDMVRRAILDVLDEIHPGARTKIFELAHARLSGAGPGSDADAGAKEFFRSAHAAIDAIVQAPKV